MFLRGLVSLYSWTLPSVLVSALKERRYNPFRFLGWFWRAENFAISQQLVARDYFLAFLVGAGMLAQAITGVLLLVDWARFGTEGSWAFGLALMLSAPIAAALALAFGALAWKSLFYIAHPKKLGRLLVCTVLEWQVRRLRERKAFTVVAVAGSVGKTSTKLAIAELLGRTKRVRHQSGNYNDRVTVPLVFFGLDAPNILNVLAWAKIFRSNERALKQAYPFDVVVVELGTDGPGFMRDFAYVKPDITVLTAITPEHMEYFKTLDAVAAEELTVFDYSKQVLLNSDDIPGKYLAGYEFVQYSTTSTEADFYAAAQPNGFKPQPLVLDLRGRIVRAETQFLGAHGAKFALAAAAVAAILEVDIQDIAVGISGLKAFSGRLQILSGVNGSTLIDDTYNASPVAVKAALDVLYGAKTKQRIAILGSMNELGDYSPEAHKEVGQYCDAAKLNLVVTIGTDAKKYLAPMAKKQGCTVKTFTSPYAAGNFVLKELQKGAVVLAKGSQNGVFAEEALKALLADPTDTQKLTRQSGYWMKQKRQQFPDSAKEQ